MIYALPALLASSMAFSPTATLAPHRMHRANMPPLVMATADEGRRAQLASLATCLAGVLGSSTAASAAEPRSTPWAYSTFLEAVENDQIEKVSFSPDGKQVLSIDRDGNRCAQRRCTTRGGRARAGTLTSDAPRAARVRIACRAGTSLSSFPSRVPTSSSSS